MRNSFLLILIISGLTSCNFKQNNYLSQLSSYEDINDLVLEVIKSDTMKTRMRNELWPRLSSIHYSFDLENLKKHVEISDNDIKFLRFQNKTYKGIYLDLKKFKKYELCDIDSNNYSVQHFSVPLLSIDKKYLFIEISYDVGPLSGEGHLIIFEKKGNRWVEIKRIYLWVS